ncbi:MAG: Gfo/Idh/MocA family protein [Prolixibacteraceae bacterium]
MGRTFNWAILGCGKIARKFSSDLKLLSNANLYATASRDLKKSQDFAAEFGFEKAYGSYEEMLNDKNVDVVYIATPHSFHHRQTIMCLAINKNEAQEMIDAARENNTFLMEAFWTMFQPSFIQAMEIINSGELGNLRMVRSEFAFNAPYDPENRLYNVKLGGGSLLDIGIYPVFAALSSLGKPEIIKTFADFADTGSEESISIIFKYKNGEMANLTSGFSSYSPIQTEYWCEDGYLILHPRWFTPTDITVWKKDREIKMHKREHLHGTGYQYEAAHVMECLEAGKIESDRMTWQMSLDLMETLDRIRIDAGIYFPEHDSKLFF